VDEKYRGGKAVFIVYSNEEEVIVTTPNQEKATLKVWFAKGNRDVDDYDRREVNETAVSVCSRLHVE
jgi:hypothetical protein